MQGGTQLARRTVALNGGPAVVYTGFATDLKVTGPNGEVVYLNTSAVPPAYNGTIALTASGTLSVDGGATTTPITFAANQVITNSVTGAVTNVNSTAIRGAGDERLDYTGSYDAFQVLMSLRDDLRNLRGLSDHDQTLALSQRLAELERVQGGVLRATGQQAADLQNLDGIESRAQDVRLETQKLVNDVNGGHRGTGRWRGWVLSERAEAATAHAEHTDHDAQGREHRAHQVAADRAQRQRDRVQADHAGTSTARGT